MTDPITRRKRERLDDLILALAFGGFIISGLFYLLAPPTSTFRFYETNVPAMLWGAVFIVGAGVAMWGALKRIPHVQRLGLMFVIIAGTVLTANQTLLMFDEPITWTRGGGTVVLAAYTLITLVLWRKLKPRVDIVNLAADIEEGGDGS